MCTVTFIPTKQTFFLTSNRDEGVLRAPASMPEVVRVGSGNIIFPRDGQAGGTWVAVHENGHAMVLLNGAFERHRHLPPYRKSRGLIFLDIFDHHSPANYFTQIDLHGIEPFTLVIWQEGLLWEARWDGRQKFLKALDSGISHIWSSATLYDVAVRERRADWFANWQAQQAEFTSENIRHFHAFGGNGDADNDLRMNRDGKLLTVSITGISLSATVATMAYQDLQAGDSVTLSLPLKNSREG